MRTLHFRASGQRLRYEDDGTPPPVAGSEGYLQARFALGPEWRGMKVAASFFDAHGGEHAVLLDRRRCMIPSEALAGRVIRVALTGVKEGTKIATNVAIVPQEVIR
jgi:hypothetical protein